MSPRTAFVSRSREAALGPIEVRRTWLVFLAAAKAQGQLAVSGHWPFVDDARSFDGLIFRLATGFPSRRAGVESVAVAALRLGRALAAMRQHGPDREEIGALLLGGVAFLERVLTEEVEAATDIARRINGEAGEGGED